MDDFIRTLDSDAEDLAENEELQLKEKNKRKGTQEDAGGLNPEFVFDLTGNNYLDILTEQGQQKDIVQTGSKPQPISVDDIIARHKSEIGTNPRKRKREEEKDDESDDESSEDGSESTDSESGEPGVVNDSDEDEESPSKTEEEEETSPSEASEEELETAAEREQKAAFFAAPDQYSTSNAASFLTMNLSRPITKALTSLSFHTPTPIQAATVPAALLGKDIVGNAVTGSGKTAAFMIPILERLLYRDKGKLAAATRCLILVPTRELAVQCFDVGTKLAVHTDVRFALVVGGLSLKTQETTLRSRPDVVIATPGRLIDHLRNSPIFNLDSLDVLVLDEADRMLSDGFADELTEIVKACPKSRQTMLFSATMTDSVDELVRMSLDKPVRLFVDPKRSTAKGLVQEFVRVKAGREPDRAALLVALCKRTFKEKVIIFFRSKKLAHQMRIMFGLLDLPAEELHGDLTQEQRLSSLQRFRDSKVNYLMATDLASRGLDIKGIETVINYDMPGQFAQYLHRVGRTARAGKRGRSVTLVGEADRKMLKAAIKHGTDEDKVRHRIVPPDAVEKWSTQLESLQDNVKHILEEEKESKHMRKAEMELQKGENLLKYEEEIHSRPARTWFQSSKEKLKSQGSEFMFISFGFGSNKTEISRKQYEAGFGEAKENKKAMVEPNNHKPKRDKHAGLSRRVKRRKLAQEEDAKLDAGASIESSIRSAKKAQRPTKIGMPEPRNFKLHARRSKEKQKGSAKKLGRGMGFGKDASDISKRAREGTHAKKTDALGGGKKKKARTSGKR
ncbi:nucleolar DEAD-box protein required for synthesis of 60S ribosomal subunit [Serendipita sp. 407]|nr:nucleolar DEAD-box protein required for synthesis of 60S ribosomal subunit [Serendipita sp. 407]